MGSLKYYFNLSGARRRGHLIRMNTHTAWFKVMIGAKSCLIVKRHLIKNNVVSYE